VSVWAARVRADACHHRTADDAYGTEAACEVVHPVNELFKAASANTFRPPGLRSGTACPEMVR